MRKLKSTLFRLSGFVLVFISSYVYANDRAHALPLHGGCITSGNQTIIINTIPEPVTATTATNGNCAGAYAYQWQSSTDGIYYTNITGANNQHLTYSQPISQTTYYQRKATCAHEVQYTAYITVTTVAFMTFYNVAMSQTFYKFCHPGITGSAVVYSVGANVYSSVTSQAAANQLGQDDINANGQTYANTNGTCNQPFYNSVQNGSFTRNNCAAGYTGSTVIYTIDTGIYSSNSQYNADQLAIYAVASNGQAYANANGTCTQNSGCDVNSCSANNLKCINNICETGTWVAMSRVLRKGVWYCTYRYCFSDFSTSTYFEEISNGTTPCTLQSCTPSVE